MVAGVAAVDIVIAVRVDLHFKLLVGLHEGFAHFVGIAHVYVVIGCAVDEQEVAVKLGGAADGAAVVARGVLLRRAHIALGIDGVVVFPVAGGGNGHTSAEDGTAFAHRHQRVESAEAPTPNGDAVLVDEGEGAQIEGGFHLVLALKVAQIEIGAFLEVGTAAARATTIHADVDIAALGHVALEHAAAEEAEVPRIGHLLRARAAILVHDDGIAARGVEILGLDHPSVELDALAGGEGKELLRAESAVDFLFQVGVVHEGGQRLARGIAEGGDGRLLGGGIDVHEILHSCAERGGVCARLLREARHLALAVGHIDLLTQGALGACGIEEAARSLVVAIEMRHFEVALRHGLLQLAVEGVPIELLIARALGEEGEVALVELHVGVGCLADVAVVGLAQHHLGFGGAGIDHIDLHAVLVAIEGDDGEFGGVVGEVDAGNVAVGIEGHLEGSGDAVLDVVGVDAHLGVGRACHGIFIGVFTGVEVVVGMGGMAALEHLHVIDIHAALVVAHPSEHLAVGRETEGTVGGELLFVDPIGDAVDDFVELAVLRHLYLCIAIEELDDEEVALAHEADDVAIGRELRHLLRAARGEGHEGVVLDIKEVVLGREGAAVDGLGLGLEQDKLLVGREDVAIDGLEFDRALGLGGIEEGGRLLASAEGGNDDAAIVAGKLRVVLAVLHRLDAIDIAGRIGTVRDVAERECVGLCLHRRKGQAEERGQAEDDFFHILNGMGITRITWFLRA